MATVSANGIDLYYEVHGSGEPAVLIQGLGANITGWDSQLEPLSKQYKLIAARVPEARFVPFEGAGHGFLTERADAVNRAVLDFWGEHETHSATAK